MLRVFSCTPRLNKINASLLFPSRHAQFFLQQQQQQQQQQLRLALPLPPMRTFSQQTSTSSTDHQLIISPRHDKVAALLRTKRNEMAKLAEVGQVVKKKDRAGLSLKETLLNLGFAVQTFKDTTEDWVCFAEGPTAMGRGAPLQNSRAKRMPSKGWSPTTSFSSTSSVSGSHLQLLRAKLNDYDATELQEAWRMFDDLVEADQVQIEHCNLMCASCVDSAEMVDLINMSMLPRGIPPNEPTYQIYIERLMIEGAYDKVREECQQCNISESTVIQELIALREPELQLRRRQFLMRLKRIGGEKATKAGWNLVDLLAKRNIVDAGSFNAVIQFSQMSHQIREIMDRTMMKCNVAPDVDTYNLYLARLRVEGHTTEFCERVVREEMCGTIDNTTTNNNTNNNNSSNNSNNKATTTGITPNKTTATILERSDIQVAAIRGQRLQRLYDEGGEVPAAAAWDLLKQVIARNVATVRDFNILLRFCHSSEDMAEIISTMMLHEAAAETVAEAEAETATTTTTHIAPDNTTLRTYVERLLVEGKGPPSTLKAWLTEDMFESLSSEILASLPQPADRKMTRMDVKRGDQLEYFLFRLGGTTGEKAALALMQQWEEQHLVRMPHYNSVVERYVDNAEIFLDTDYDLLKAFKIYHDGKNRSRTHARSLNRKRQAADMVAARLLHDQYSRLRKDKYGVHRGPPKSDPNSFRSFLKQQEVKQEVKQEVEQEKQEKPPQMIAPTKAENVLIDVKSGGDVNGNDVNDGTSAGGRMMRSNSKNEDEKDTVGVNITSLLSLASSWKQDEVFEAEKYNNSAMYRFRSGYKKTNKLVAIHVENNTRGVACVRLVNTLLEIRDLWVNEATDNDYLSGLSIVVGTNLEDHEDDDAKKRDMKRALLKKRPTLNGGKGGVNVDMLQGAVSRFLKERLEPGIPSRHIYQHPHDLLVLDQDDVLRWFTGTQAKEWDRNLKKVQGVLGSQAERRKEVHRAFQSGRF